MVLIPNPCPAKGKNSNKRHNIGHFAQVCRSKATRIINKVASSDNCPDYSNSDNGLYVIDIVNAVGKQPSIKIMFAFETVRIPFSIDTGSSVNILDDFKDYVTSLKSFNFSKSKPS